MAVTPSTLNLTHKKYSGTYNSQNITFVEPSVTPEETGRELITVYKPSWLTIVRTSEGNASVTVNANADDFQPGTHNASITIIIRVYSTIDLDPPKNIVDDYTMGIITVNLIIESTVVLTLSKYSLNYTYELGAANPLPQTINVLSESTWNVTKTKNWVTLSAVTGTNNGSFNVSVVPDGLAVGTHTDVITVTDALFTKTISLSLVISEADTGSIYLYVSPASMEFNYTIGGYSAIKVAEFNASGNWSVAASQTWISLSASGGTAGVGSIQVTLQNADLLAPGTHYAEITFTQGGLVKTIYVTLNVYDLVQSVLNDQTLYFADDENIIEVSSLRENTFLSIEMNSTFEGNIYTGIFAIPFFKGTGSRRIGAFPKKIIGTRKLPVLLNEANIFIPYLTALINMTIKEEEITSDQISQVINLNNIKFIKGATPSNNWLSDMPTKRYMTSKGLLLSGILSNGSTPIKIDVTGDITQSISLSVPSNDLFGFVLPLESLSGLEVGSLLTVTILGNSLIVEIIPNGIDYCVILWENQWGLWDAVECTGEIIDTNSYKSSSAEFNKDHLTKEIKVLESETSSDIKINTGLIYSQEYKDSISKMIGSTNIYILRNGALIKVKSTTRKAELYKTLKPDDSFDLTFENVLI